MDDNQPDMFMCHWKTRTNAGHSGMMTYDDALRWANQRLGIGAVECIYLMRVISTLRRDIAPIVVVPGYSPPPPVQGNNNG